MKLLFQRSLRSCTRSIGEGKIMAEAVLLSTDCEIVARLVAAADTFLIEQAEWELLRQGAEYAPCGGAVPVLLGVEAYFGVAAALTRAFPDPDQELAREMFAECVKAVLQSETYLYSQRGFANSQAYQDNWDISHPNSCRYYSHLDTVQSRWFDHIGPRSRTQNLFHRHKNVAVWQTSGNLLQATGSFLDSFHEVGIAAECDLSGKIKTFAATFMRAPDQICFGTAKLVHDLVGQNIRQLTRREINRCAGGAEGCAHLLDIGRDTVAEVHKALKSIDGICG
jgi:hypothetical protein